MKRLRLLLCFFLSIIACFPACEHPEAIPFTTCPNAGAFVRKADKMTGTVYYDSTTGRYGIQVATSFDSADMGYSCNLPTKYQKAQMKVRFTGSYYEYDKPIKGPAGYRFYYLTLESISQ